MVPAAEPRLLASDREGLEHAARVLTRGTGFILLVCPPDLQPAAWSALKAIVHALRPTVEVGSGDEMFAQLKEAAEAPEGAPVVSLALHRGAGEAREALVTLNLHREKVLKGAPVVLWLPDADAVAAMREVAPDAYSFRSAIVLLQGDGGALPRRKVDEPEDIALARRRLKRAKTPLEKARAGTSLAASLRTAGHLSEAWRIAQDALGVLEEARDDEERELHVFLLSTAASIAADMGQTARSLPLVHQALKEADALPLGKSVAHRTFDLAGIPGPFGLDRESSSQALDLAERWGVEPKLLSEALRATASVLRSLGDLRGARQAVARCQSISRLLSPFVQALIHYDQAWIAAESGDFAEVEPHFRNAIQLRADTGGDAALAWDGLTRHLLDRGELIAAERHLDDMELTGERRTRARALRIELLLVRGRVVECLPALEQALDEASYQHQDQYHLNVCSQLAGFAIAAHHAGRLLPEELSRILVDLDAAQYVSLTITAPDPPPWYPILFRLLRGHVRALDPVRLPEAISLVREALDLARTTYPDLVPQCGRELAEHLLLASQPDETLALLQEIEPEAISRGMLKELACIRATQVRALVQQSSRPPQADPAAIAGPTALDERMSALRAALDSTGSRRITAETLLGLAIDLPPACAHPDVLQLAEETQVIFFEMPMPAREARATEVAGHALLARGRPGEARRRYVAARARLERFGLALRIPTLDCKLAALAGADADAPSTPRRALPYEAS